MSNKVITLDVRDEIRGGREPFAKIMTAAIQWGVQNALLNLEGVEDAEVEVVWDPPWHPSMMTEFGRNATGVGRF
jgi:hypothetical protein